MKNFVVAYGQDCDGANSGHITRYIDEQEAIKQAASSNEFSDGLIYTPVDLAQAERYSNDYNKNIAPSLLPVFKGSEIVEKIMTWEEFGAEYKPMQNHVSNRDEFNGWLFETYGEDEKYVREFAQLGNNGANVWTIIEGEQNQMCIISGWHFVNRFGYVITEVPCPEGRSITVEDEEDKVLEEDSDVTN